MARNPGMTRLALAAALAVGLGGTSRAEAQSLGTFQWQLQPYCNLVSVTVTQNGALYTLDGYDDQCGAPTRASVVGTAVPNPNGTITLGFTIVTTPDGTPVHVQTALSLATLGGPWSDSAGHTGTLVFTAGAGTGGAPRPAPITTLAPGSITSTTILDGTVGAADINQAQVQARVTGSCPAGASIRAISTGGGVACETDDAGGAGVTDVTGGVGLSGGGAGSVTLDVEFAGSGGAQTVARSDHHHQASGAGSVAVGFNALGAATSGLWNTAVGSLALSSLTTQNYNTALGTEALRNNTGSYNVAVGSGALLQTTTGGLNVAVGHLALRNSLTGGSNVGLGYAALVNATGSSNVGVGTNALNQMTSGSSNIAIGSGAGTALTSGNSNIYIGHGGAVESGTIRVGSTGQTRAFIGGIRGITTGQNDALPVVVDSAGQLGTVSSSRKTKFDIADLDPTVTSAVHRLRPVQFRYLTPFADGSTPIQYGLVAEEVEAVLPDLVAYDDAGQPASVKYHVLPGLLLAEVQRLERERVTVASLLAAQTDEVARLRAAVAQLESAVAVMAEAAARR